MTPRNTRPAEEIDLKIPNDVNPFDPNASTEPPKLFKVLIDGKPGLAGIGSLSGYSERILLVFDEPHPEFGEEFMTKYFMFDNNEPGLLLWGHQNRSFKIDLIIEDE